MARFERIWAVRSHDQHQPGDFIPVKLKSGKIKSVQVDKLAFTGDTDNGVVYFYLPRKNEDE
jgi:hypothetical protein